MAEYVWKRITAAKLSVSLAIAALVGGFAARDDGVGAIASDRVGSESSVGPNEITRRANDKEGSALIDALTSRHIKNHSLLFQDLKRGEIYSRKNVDVRFQKVNESVQKVTESSYTKQQVDSSFLKLADAEAQYQKVSEARDLFVEGDGSVFTGFEVATDEPVEILDVPGLVRLDGVPGRDQEGPRVRVTNIGAAALGFASTEGGDGTIAADGSVSVALGGPDTMPVATVQLVSLAPGSPDAATLTLSAIRDAGAAGTTHFIGQALVGAESEG
jgi:hypothetical protein